jgi:putative ABC transport system permease protein
MWRWRRRSERDFADEIAANIAIHTDLFVAEGMNPEDARAAARRAFGNVTRAEERFYESRRVLWLDAVQRDIRSALRNLRTSPGLTATVVLVLGLGLGVNNTFFTLVYALGVRGLTLPGIDRVLAVDSLDPQGRPGGVSYRDFIDARDTSARSLEGLAAYAAASLPIGDEGKAPDRALGTYISANAFQLVRQAPLLGRAFLAEEDRTGAPAVVLLGYGVWQTRYAGDREVVGRTVIVNGVPSTVVGVMPHGFGFPNDADLWLPLASMPGISAQPRSARTLKAFARLTSGATMSEAIVEVGAIGTRLAHDYPEADAGVRLTVDPINRRYTARLSDPTWIQFIVAGVLVLIIACANVASLLLMRAIRRGHEMALRASLGATRWRLVRQLLVESVLLAAIGGAFGLALSLVGLRFIARDSSLPSWMSLTMDGRVFGVLAGISLGTVFLFGLVPALHVSRVDVQAGLKDGARDTSGGRSRRWTGVLLATEFALTMILMGGLGESVRSIAVTRRAQVSIEPGHILTTWLTLPNQTYATTATRRAFLDRVHTRVGMNASVSAFALASALPFEDGVTRPLTISGRETQSGDALPPVSTVSISADYFKVLDVTLLEGRPFDDADGTAGHETAIINARLAEMFLGDGVRLGRRIRLADRGGAEGAPWLTIVGVSPNVRQHTQGLLPDPVVYTPIVAAPPASLALMARTAYAPGALAAPLREAVRGLDPTLPLYRTRSLDDVINQNLWNARISQDIIATIALIGLLLSAVGLYAVAAHAVADRTREIGLRMALGAQRAQVVWPVLRGALRSLAAGMVVGALGSVLWSQLWLPRNPDALLQPRATDPAVLIPVVLVMTTVELVACYLPARRATSVDPMIALRCE